MPGKSLCCPRGNVKSGAKFGCSLIESRGLGQIDGAQVLHAYLYLLLRILGWTYNYLDISRKILGFANQVS